MNFHPLTMLLLGFVFGVAPTIVCHEIREQRLRDALSALVEAIVLDDSDQFHRAERTAEALRGARKALGHDPQTTE